MFRKNKYQNNIFHAENIPVFNQDQAISLWGYFKSAYSPLTVVNGFSYLPLIRIFPTTGAKVWSFVVCVFLTTQCKIVHMDVKRKGPVICNIKPQCYVIFEHRQWTTMKIVKIIRSISSWPLSQCLCSTRGRMRYEYKYCITYNIFPYNWMSCCFIVWFHIIK